MLCEMFQILADMFCDPSPLVFYNIMLSNIPAHVIGCARTAMARWLPAAGLKYRVRQDGTDSFLGVFG